jgi:phage replication initiation protein
MAQRRIRNSKTLPLSRTQVDEVLDSARQKTAVSLAKQEAATAGTCAAGAAKRPSPTTNRGVKGANRAIAARLVLEDGVVLEIPARRGHGGSAAFVDWLNFTCHEDAFAVRQQGFTDDEVITEVSFVCDSLFGFGITSQRESGANFYQRSYVLGENLGMVCHGGQRNTVLVMLSGEGCAAALDGWEGRAVEFFKKSRAKITRCDLAYDDYAGGMTVDDVELLYDQGMFQAGGRAPGCEMRGDWKNPNGKGRTFYVGGRANGKYLRAYEKGMQLGDKTSPWVRLEVEFKSVNRELPYEMLLLPGAYLAAAYPALGHLSEKQCRIKTMQKSSQIKYAAGVENMRKQCGAWLWAICNIEGGAEQAFQKLMRPMMPRRLVVPDASSGPLPLHKQGRPKFDADMVIEMSFQ